MAALSSGTHRETLSLEELVLSTLDAEVGGRMRLQALDDSPLPDEPFEWAGIPEDIHPVVQEMLDACDNFADEIDDVEYRTAMRRFLSRAAAGDPSVFRRRGSTARGAAAVAWVISQANHLFSAKFIQESFGLKSSVAPRAQPMLEAIGLCPDQYLNGPVRLGAPDLLLSTHRAQIVQRRDRALAGFNV